MLQSRSAISKTSKVLNRRFNSTRPSLYEPYLPNQIPQPTDFASAPVAKVTQTKSGVKVATLFSKSPVVSLGYFVNGGSRAESGDLIGASFFFPQFAFKSTMSGRSSLRVTREPDLFGGQYSVTSGREYLLYSTKVLSDAINEGYEHLTDVLSPKLQEYELKDVKSVIPNILDQVQSNPEELLMDLVHQEAFRNRGLGNSLYTPRYRLDSIGPQQLSSYHQANFKPSNMTLVGLGGIEHEALVEKVEQAFGSNESSKTEVTSSEYFGGDLRIGANGPTHIAFGFKGFSYKDPKSIALRVLRHLIGNESHATGRNFGKPGSGLASPLGNLFTSQSLLSASTFNFNYSDTGLFGITAVADKDVGATVAKLNQLLQSISKSITAASVERAKAQLKLATFEQYGSSLMLSVYQQSQNLNACDPTQLSQQIDGVTLQDVQAVAKQVLSSTPTLVVLGDIHSVPKL